MGFRSSTLLQYLKQWLKNNWVPYVAWMNLDSNSFPYVFCNTLNFLSTQLLWTPREDTVNTRAEWRIRNNLSHWWIPFGINQLIHKLPQLYTCFCLLIIHFLLVNIREHFLKIVSSRSNLNVWIKYFYSGYLTALLLGSVIVVIIWYT